MPQRLLKPGLTTSRRFNALDWPAQSFYVRLITIVDDYGRAEADHSLLASLCFPMYRADKCPHIADICQQLAVNGMAIFYTVDGTDYLQLTRWKERVRSESRHPAPPADSCQQHADICQQMIASPPQPQPQPQPAPVRRTNCEVPSWETFWSYCEIIGLAAEWYANDKFLAAEQDNWNGKSNWQAYAARCRKWWENDGRPMSPPKPKASPQNGGMAYNDPRNSDNWTEKEKLRWVSSGIAPS